eukprot:863159-Pelagomonas_calceolata.AAC.1
MLWLHASPRAWPYRKPCEDFDSAGPVGVIIPTHLPWSSARRATARRRSPDRTLMAGVEKKTLSIGGSQRVALSLMHAAERQTPCVLCKFLGGEGEVEHEGGGCVFSV